MVAPSGRLSSLTSSPVLVVLADEGLVDGLPFFGMGAFFDIGDFVLVMFLSPDYRGVLPPVPEGARSAGRRDSNARERGEVQSAVCRSWDLWRRTKCGLRNATMQLQHLD